MGCFSISPPPFSMGSRSQSISGPPIEKSGDDVATDSQQPRPSSSQIESATPITTASTSASASLEYPPSTPHQNPHGLLILSDQSRGRGVYASRPLRAGTLVEISPVLLFGKAEWESHGSETVLQSYTFKWGRMGEMALALGLGESFHTLSLSLSHA